MKRCIAFLMALVLCLTIAACANRSETPLNITEGAPYDPNTGEFLMPPKGYLVTDTEKTELRLGGYTWSQVTGHGTAQTMHTDQYRRPLALNDMPTITVYTNSLFDGGYLDPFPAEMAYRVALDWQVAPDAVSYVCWRANRDMDGELHLMDKKIDNFIANKGSFIYEINASWLDHGTGFSGKASYYIHIIVELEG